MATLKKRESRHTSRKGTNMGTTRNVATLLPGRSYQVGGTGLSNLTRRYQVLRDPHSPDSTLEVTSIDGLPAIGSAHPNHPVLFVDSYHVSEDDNGLRWVIEVMYTTSSGGSSGNPFNRPPKGQPEQSRGWTMQEIHIDLVYDETTKKPVINVNGQPFESTPQIPRMMPVFQLVKKSNTTPSQIIANSGTVNEKATTIDGISIGARCGRLTITDEKLYDDPDGYSHKYTFQIAKMSHIVKIDGSDIDIGWDVAFIEQGLYFKNDEGVVVRAQELDEETKTPRPTAYPVLLDKDGKRLAAGAEPVTKRVATQPSAQWTGLLW